ncbi:MAG: NADH-quinone oxidoreductase subunit J [Chloroflexi bacterium]|nr:NADH-quinone oxidoreductase subunit J [Chloroflexota bacterium]MDA8188336.1 NADH-quinone oxidoreductase subunit J [Dehalococcoidales bacterium]
MNDPIIAIAFFVLAAVLLISALAVVMLRNIVHSALFLALAFVSVAGFYILLNAEFLAAVQILIYAGAVMILLLFAIMLTQRANTPMSNVSNSQAGLAAIVAAAVFVVLAFVLSKTSWLTGAAAVTQPNTEVLGKALFDYYVLPFEIASVLLLVAMIGAIVIARED